MPYSTYLVYAFLTVAAIVAAVARKLTMAGSVTAFVVGVLVFTGGGYTALVMLIVFFIAGTMATIIGYKQKQQYGMAERDKGRRTAGQVLANGGVAAILGLMAILMPDQSSIFLLMIAGSLAAATADTLSSELGTLCGRRFYNILTLKKDQRGLDGVVSIEGTLIGVAGAIVIALIYGIGTGWNLNLLRIIVAGTMGNLVDSALGAALERRNLIKNNWVNFLNTLTGALACWLLNRFVNQTLTSP